MGEVFEKLIDATGVVPGNRGLKLLESAVLGCRESLSP